MELSVCGEEKKFLLEQLRQRGFQRSRGIRIFGGAVISLAVVLSLSLLLFPEAVPGFPQERNHSFSETAPTPAGPLDTEGKTAKSPRWLVI